MWDFDESTTKRRWCVSLNFLFKWFLSHFNTFQVNAQLRNSKIKVMTLAKIYTFRVLLKPLKTFKITYKHYLNKMMSCPHHLVPYLNAKIIKRQGNNISMQLSTGLFKPYVITLDMYCWYFCHSNILSRLPWEKWRILGTTELSYRSIILWTNSRSSLSSNTYTSFLVFGSSAKLHLEV